VCCCLLVTLQHLHLLSLTLQVGQALPAERLYDCVNVILSYQNFDGGMATYENTRSFHALEVGGIPPSRPAVAV
jgi:hypothetical protein